MKITKQWLKKYSACSKAVNWYNKQNESDLFKLYKKALKEKYYNWINWTITKIFNRKQRIQYAVFAAKQEDKRPQQSINAAIKCINNNTKKNRTAAAAAAAAAYTARKKMQKKILNYGINLLSKDTK